MTTPDTAGLPCPFCGHVGVNVHEASTFRWVLAECNGCGAQGPEARRNTMESWPNEPVDTAKALAEWNTRTAQAAQPTGWPPGMLQDDSRELSKWLANKPDALQHVKAEQPERKPLSDAEAWAAIDAIFCYRGDYSMAVFRAAEKVHGIGEPS